MRARLIVEKGEAIPPICDLDVCQPVTLGRSRDNTIVLQDEHASRHHAQIVRDEDRWVLHDLGTLNGTFINGQRIAQPTPLEDGQIVGIADMRLRFSLVGSQVQPPESPPPPQDSTGTTLWADDLARLHEFMMASVKEDDFQAIVERTLETVARQSGACLVGFLNQDPEHPVSKMSVPRAAEVDVALSRRLTQRVHQTGTTAWLQGVRGQDASGSHDSFAGYRDALCVPLFADEGSPGALHGF